MKRARVGRGEKIRGGQKLKSPSLSHFHSLFLYHGFVCPSCAPVMLCVRAFPLTNCECIFVCRLPTEKNGVRGLCTPLIKLLCDLIRRPSLTHPHRPYTQTHAHTDRAPPIPLLHVYLHLHTHTHTQTSSALARFTQTSRQSRSPRNAISNFFFYPFRKVAAGNSRYTIIYSNWRFESNSVSIRQTRFRHPASLNNNTMYSSFLFPSATSAHILFVYTYNNTHTIAVEIFATWFSGPPPSPSVHAV